MADAQASINQQGVGFKGFIPATFARLVNEAFARRVGSEASVKVTAPANLVRNRKARPDAWETTVIADRFLVAGWQRGTPFAEVVSDGAAPRKFRMALPEYYASSCLSCHGAPKAPPTSPATRARARPSTISAASSASCSANPDRPCPASPTGCCSGPRSGPG